MSIYTVLCSNLLLENTATEFHFVRPIRCQLVSETLVKNEQLAKPVSRFAERIKLQGRNSSYIHDRTRRFAIASTLVTHCIPYIWRDWMKITILSGTLSLFRRDLRTSPMRFYRACLFACRNGGSMIVYRNQAPLQTPIADDLTVRTTSSWRPFHARSLTCTSFSPDHACNDSALIEAVYRLIVVLY